MHFQHVRISIECIEYLVLVVAVREWILYVVRLSMRRGLS